MPPLLSTMYHFFLQRPKLAHAVNIVLSVLFGLGGVASLWFGLLGLLVFLLTVANLCAMWDSHVETMRVLDEADATLHRMSVTTRKALQDASKEKSQTP